MGNNGGIMRNSWEEWGNNGGILGNNGWAVRPHLR